MRQLLIFLAMTFALPANAGLFDDLKFALTGHVKDFKSRSQPDQILEGGNVLAETRFRTDDPGQDAVHYGEGGVSLIEKNGEIFIQLSPDLNIGFAPDLYLYVSMDQKITDEARFNMTQQIEVAELVKGEGASFYSLGALDPQQTKAVKSVTVWCRKFGEFMASADF